MARKSVCSMCNEELGFLSLKSYIYDGCVCHRCLRKAKIKNFDNAASFTQIAINKMLQRRISLIESFKTTKKIGKYLQIDEINQGVKIADEFFEYENLFDCELLEDEKAVSVEKLGIGEAAVGGVLFGRAGAFLGALVGSEITLGACSSLKIRLTLKDTYVDTVCIPFIQEKTSKRSAEYKALKEKAESCYTALKVIVERNNYSKENSKIDMNVDVDMKSSTVSIVTELRQYKELLDEGVLTQEEFEAKKKQLLGIEK